ncbi:MAG: hypothetical protein P4M12_11185 [Gammaproteobacteria bacterium]|nr:hypothetical protein [Gammaproteobacteria bacterium]
MQTLSYKIGNNSGNTFVIFDLINCPKEYNEQFCIRAHAILMQENCDDILILLPKKNEPDAVHIDMLVLGRDKQFGAFCGNGSLAVAAYWYQKYGTNSQLILHAKHKSYQLYAYDNNEYGVSNLVTSFDHEQSNFVIELAPFVTYNGVSSILILDKLFYFTETGEPHLVSNKPLSLIELDAIGTYVNTLRNYFPEGINVTCIQSITDNTVEIMTYERGTHCITQACGSGAASAVALASKQELIPNHEITVRFLGGKISIYHQLATNTSVIKGRPSITDSTLLVI